MKKFLLVLCSVLLVCAIGSKNVSAGGFPGQEMPSSIADADTKALLESIQKQLSETKAELDKTKQELNDVKRRLAVTEQNAGQYSGHYSNDDALPLTCGTPFQPMPARQEKFQFFVSNEFYFVKPRGFGPFVGIQENSAGVPDGKLDQLEFDYDLSFDITSGFKLCNDCGEVSVSFWHYEDRVSADFEPDYFDHNGGSGYRPIPNSYYYDFVNLDFEGRLTHAWTNLEMNILDIEYTKPFRVLSNVDLDLSIGPRLLWIDHDSYFEYYTETESESLKVGEPFDITAGGVRAGGELRIYLPWDLEVYGGTWFALLLAKVDGSYDIDYANSGHRRNVTSQIKFEDDAYTYNIDANIGMSYAPKGIFDGNLKISAGYQVMVFPRLWPGFGGYEDLTLDGATLKTEIAF